MLLPAKVAKWSSLLLYQLCPTANLVTWRPHDFWRFKKEQHRASSSKALSSATSSAWTLRPASVTFFSVPKAQKSHGMSHVSGSRLTCPYYPWLSLSNAVQLFIGVDLFLVSSIGHYERNVWRDCLNGRLQWLLSNWVILAASHSR